jgi:Zn-dependent protease
MPGAAATTERRATERAQAAIGPRILLSYLQEEDGDVAGMRQSAARLIDGLRPAGWNPLVSSLSYHVFPWTSRAGTSGYLHLSYATDGGVFAITPQGGGFLQVLNAIPRTDEFTLAEFRDFSTGFAAVQAALAADVASGDPVQAVRDASFGLAAAPAPQRSAQIEAMGPLIGAARLVAGERASNLMLAFPLAQAILRDAGRFRRALDLCRSYSAHSSVGAIAEQCASESQYFLGLAATSAPDRLREDRGALAQFEAAHRDAVKYQIGDPDAILLETAFAATSTAAEERSAGNRAAASADLALARRLYTAEAGQSFANGRDVEAQTKLGDLFYEQGDLHAAIGAYTRTTAIFKRDYPHGFPDDIAVQAEEAAYNNRGISELTLTQGTPQERPDCSALHDLCLAAASDFAHALALDPADPIALMNAGWVARLLGREEEARRLLESATVADPALYPAFNDLGVLSAESGDTTTARRDFEAALTANPRYDLAAWNLGVLDTREGLGTIIQGQAYLSRAIAENRSLRSSELEYKTDERVYRYVVGVDAPNGQALDRGYGIAAATLGWLTLLAALYAIGKHLLTDVAQERLAEFWDERVPELRERLMSRVRNWLRHLVGSGSDNIEPGKGTDRPDGSADQSDESTRRSRYPWWLALPALVLITLFLARRTSPDAALPAAALTLAATAIALLVHEAGHRVVAGYIKAQVTPEHWGSSIPLAVLAALVPAETNMGPFMGHRVEGEESAERHHWVYVGGPAANLVMAAVAYALFLAQPLPFFRLLAAVQLAVCAYALLPVEPLDGAELEEKHHIMLPLTAVLTAAGVALALGIL